MYCSVHHLVRNHCCSSRNLARHSLLTQIHADPQPVCSRPLDPGFPCPVPESRHSGSNHEPAADEEPELNTPFLSPSSIPLSSRTHESPPTAVMIPTTCAWARLGLRRIPTYPRKRIPGTASNFERTPLRTSPSHTIRRHHASKSPVGQKAPETANTIPGPSWLWLEPIYEPFRAYGRVQQRKPYMTQFISSLIIYFVGDLVAQSISTPEPALSEVVVEEGEEKGWVQEWSENRDWHRTGRSIMIGGLSSIPAYRWFLWLGNNFNYGSKILSLTTKVCLSFSDHVNGNC
jgi:hypothetical protein